MGATYAESREGNAQLLRDMEAMRGPGVSLKTVMARLGCSVTRAFRVWRAAHPDEPYLIGPASMPRTRRNISPQSKGQPSGVLALKWAGESKQEFQAKRDAMIKHARLMRPLAPVQPDEAEDLVQRFLQQRQVTACPARAVAPINNGSGF